MNRHYIFDAVYRLADRRAKRVEYTCLSDQSLDARLLRLSLRRMAGKVGAPTAIGPADAALALFCPEAIDYLLQLPNRYSFWATVRGAAVYQDILGGEVPISLRATKLAYGRVAEELARYLQELSVPVQSMSFKPVYCRC